LVAHQPRRTDVAGAASAAFHEKHPGVSFAVDVGLSDRLFTG
jgi:hypothetical protein